MKIVIQGYWNALVTTLPYEDDASMKADQRIKEDKPITICDIVINDKFVGSVSWNGKQLFIEKEEKTPLQVLKEANKRNK